MLEPPNLPNEAIIDCLRDAYGLDVARVTFLPLGADVNTAVYRVVAGDGTAYFLKLRGGSFDEFVVAIPQLLAEQGMRTVIAPIRTVDQRLWTSVDRFTVIMSPFVEGQNGFHTPLSDTHVVELGAALKQLHMTVVPRSLGERIPRETFAPHWRDQVRMFLAQAENTMYADPVAANVAAFLRAKRDAIHDVVGRAEYLAGALLARSPIYVLCHADIHAGNVLIDGDGRLFVVDWDTLLLAPKERDLMFVGAGLDIADAPGQAALFYKSYGEAAIDEVALAYYRYQRIVEDIASFCGQLLLSDEGGADREQSLGYLVGSFLPGQVVERAYAADSLSYPM